MSAPQPTLRRFDAALLRLERPWLGEVSARFAHAARVRPLPPARRALTLLRGPRGLVPWGIEWPAAWPLPAPRVRVQLRGVELLLLPPGTPPAALSLDGRGQRLRLSATPCLASVSALREQLASAALPTRTAAWLAALAGTVPAPAASFDAAVMRRGVSALHELLAALLAAEPAATLTERRAAATRALVGLGPGLTPTGDDLLTGVAAALRRFVAAGWLPAETFAALARLLRRIRPHDTTPTACQMLAHAAHGDFPLPLLAAVRVLGAPPAPALRFGRAARRLQGVGAQSGCDWLTGLLATGRALLATKGTTWNG